MTKLDLQKELLEKVKEGVKPSDIKKKKRQEPIILFDEFERKSQTSQTPPSRSLSKSDEGYSSDEGKNAADQKTTDQKNLPAQITSLKKQLQLYKDFREGDLKVKEKLKEENNTLKKTIADLQNQTKTQQEPQLTEKKKEPKLYLFTCSICDQNKKSQLHLAKVNGLGIDPTKLQKICDYCIKRVDLIQEREEDFF